MTHDVNDVCGAFDLVCRAMRSGALDLTRPWGVPEMPVCVSTGKRFLGAGIFALWARMGELESTDPRWADESYIGKRGWRIDDDASGVWVRAGKRSQPKMYFNASQIIGIPDRAKAGRSFDRGVCNRLIANCDVRTLYDAGRSEYLEAEDVMLLQSRSEFKHDDQFYAAAIHIIAHSMGHASRSAFGTSGRATVELISNMICALVMSDVGFATADDRMEPFISEHRHQGMALDIFRSDARAVERAAEIACSAHRAIMARGDVAADHIPFAPKCRGADEIESYEEVAELCCRALCDGCSMYDPRCGACEVYGDEVERCTGMCGMVYELTAGRPAKDMCGECDEQDECMYCEMGEYGGCEADAPEMFDGVTDEIIDVLARRVNESLGYSMR